MGSNVPGIKLLSELNFCQKKWMRLTCGASKPTPANFSTCRFRRNGVVVKSARLAISGAAFALIGFAVAGCGQHGGGGPPDQGTPEVGVVTLQAAPVTLTAELPGRTSPYETSDVRPQVGGIVVERPFTEGALVPRGPGALPDRSGSVPRRL